jgi:hypothetical protein
MLAPLSRLQHLAGDERNECIQDDRRIIKFSNPLIFWHTIFFRDNEIQPALAPALGFYPVNEMDDSAQKNKSNQENDGFCKPEQEIIACQETQQEKYLQDFIPPRL